MNKTEKDYLNKIRKLVMHPVTRFFCIYESDCLMEIDQIHNRYRTIAKDWNYNPRWNTFTSPNELTIYIKNYLHLEVSKPNWHKDEI